MALLQSLRIFASGTSDFSNQQGEGLGGGQGGTHDSFSIDPCSKAFPRVGSLSPCVFLLPLHRPFWLRGLSVARQLGPGLGVRGRRVYLVLNLSSSKPHSSELSSREEGVGVRNTPRPTASAGRPPGMEPHRRRISAWWAHLPCILVTQRGPEPGRRKALWWLRPKTQGGSSSWPSKNEGNSIGPREQHVHNQRQRIHQEPRL